MWRSFKTLIKHLPGAKALYARMRKMRRSKSETRFSVWLHSKVLNFLDLPNIKSNLLSGREPEISDRLPVDQVYFSIYELWPLPPARWKRNSFNWLRKKAISIGSSCDELHFLGAPLVERDGVREADYISWLNAIKGAHPRLRFVYVLHPRESSDFAQRIAQEIRVAVRRYPLPYEMELCLMERKPSAVASWFCTALDNLAAAEIPNLHLSAYRLPEIKLPKNRRRQAIIFDAAKHFYQRHESDSVVVVREIPQDKKQSILTISDQKKLEKTTPILIVQLLLRELRGGQILLGRKTRALEQGIYSLPESLLSKGETLLGSARRMLAEAGIDAESLKLRLAGFYEQIPQERYGMTLPHQVIFVYEVLLAEPAGFWQSISMDDYQWCAYDIAMAFPAVNPQVRNLLSQTELCNPDSLPKVISS